MLHRTLRLSCVERINRCEQEEQTKLDHWRDELVQRLSARVPLSYVTLTRFITRKICGSKCVSSLTLMHVKSQCRKASPPKFLTRTMPPFPQTHPTNSPVPSNLAVHNRTASMSYKSSTSWTTCDIWPQALTGSRPGFYAYVP